MNIAFIVLAMEKPTIALALQGTVLAKQRYEYPPKINKAIMRWHSHSNNKNKLLNLQAGVSRDALVFCLLIVTSMNSLFTDNFKYWS